MQLENGWILISAFIIGAAIAIPFYTAFSAMLDTLDFNAKIIVGALVTVVIIMIVIVIPIAQISNDDRGKES